MSCEGRGGGGGRGGRRKEQGPLEKYSRSLTKILRHKAVERGLTIDSAGYVDVQILLKLPEFRGLSLQLLKKIVDTNEKQRFRLVDRGDRQFIRANQGHTMECVTADELLTRLTENDVNRFPVVVHGTNIRAWQSISATGLNRMGRQHVHFATGLPGESGVVSGMRKGAQVLVYLNLAATLADGIPFFVSDNGVVLSPGVGDTGTIPTKYFSRAEHSKTGQQLWPVA